MVTEQNIVRRAWQAVRAGRANATIKPRVSAVALASVPVSRLRFLPPWRSLKEENDTTLRRLLFVYLKDALSHKMILLCVT